MKASTLSMLDTGLCELERYAKERKLPVHEEFATISMGPLDISDLRASLRNPPTIDIDRWSELFRVLQQRSDELGETHEIDTKTLLTGLQNYRDGVLK